jgi:hypothetical protein
MYYVNQPSRHLLRMCASGIHDIILLICVAVHTAAAVVPDPPARMPKTAWMHKVPRNPACQWGREGGDVLKRGPCRRFCLNRLQAVHEHAQLLPQRLAAPRRCGGSRRGAVHVQCGNAVCIGHIGSLQEPSALAPCSTCFLPVAHESVPTAAMPPPPQADEAVGRVGRVARLHCQERRAARHKARCDACRHRPPVSRLTVRFH